MLDKRTSNINKVHVIDQKIGKNYAAYNGDCVELTRGIPDNSIHYTIFSPPFASLFTYSNSDRDMGNAKSDQEFFKHFSYLVPELHRITMPGRLVSVHCMNIPSMKERDGVIGLKDFRGDIIRMFMGSAAIFAPAIIEIDKRIIDASDDVDRKDNLLSARQALINEMNEHSETDFIYHSEVCIWKDPLIEATRTKSLGLMHKQIQKDSSMCRQGLPDYICTFRKKGENQERIEHKNGFESFHGDDEPKERGIKYSHNVWRRYADPVWDDISQGDTLNGRMAREKEDERHICPLQLQTIARCIDLWSNPGDIVFSPFGGIGSEGYQALEMGRKAILIELKKSYFHHLCKHLDSVENRPVQTVIPGCE